MKIEELNELKEKVIKIQDEIKRLEETEEIKRYLNLWDLLEEKTTGRNNGIKNYTNKKRIDI